MEGKKEEKKERKETEKEREEKGEMRGKRRGKHGLIFQTLKIHHDNGQDTNSIVVYFCEGLVMSKWS